MRCPICKSINLNECSMITGLKGFKCEKCEGAWVRYSDYENWKNETQHNIEDNLAEYMPEYDYKKAILCPDCGIILIKYKVAKNISFNLDHCNVCNGVWLNKSEWESLIRNNLHYQMNSFFTKPWQNKLRLEMTSERLEQKYQQSFGNEDYNKLVEIRKWIYGHAKKDELIHFLIDENPYRI